MNSKDILAKLMATENITVEYNQSVNTAMFNTESRTLILPVLENITPEVTDLFLGHEVGHALFTPMGQWDKIAKLGSDFKNIVNIVEDVRIEKMIQAKFAGLRKIFVKGYNNLLEKNFFGTDGHEYSDYNLLDRLNLHFKLGTLAQVPFSAEEIEWRDKVDSCSSWEDVLSISEDLLNFLKSDQDEQEDKEVDEDGEAGNVDASDMESEDSLDKDNSNNDGTMSEDSETSDDGNEAAGESDKESSEDQQEKMTNNIAGNGSAAGEDDNEIVSHTQDSFDKSINNNILNDKDRSVINVYMDNLPIDDHMISLEEFHSVYETHIAGNYSNSLGIYEDAKSNIAMIHNEQKSLVSYLHKEFEMRKSADEYKRTRVAKTGVLNPNKLHAYKFSEDIFLRSNVVSDGKSHGFIMFLDWSSSMTGRIHSTIEQLMMMCSFCKKANIPFEVYTFTATEKKHLLEADDRKKIFYNSDQPDEEIPAEKRFRFQSKFSLVNIFNSASKINFNRQMMFLELLRSPYANRYNYDKKSLLYNGPANWGLKNTPLRSALVCATDLIKSFRKKNGTQIVNLCCLSDGAPNDTMYYKGRHSLSGRPCWNSFMDGYDDVNIIDRENGYTDFVSSRDIYNNLSPYIKRIKSIPNVNVINYFLVNPKSTVIYAELRYLADSTIPEADISPWALKDYCKVICKNIKNNGFHSQPKLQGFDEFYILPDRHSRDDEDGLSFDDNMTKAKKVTAFIKNRKGRMINKKMLSHFAEVVSK